MSLPRPLPGRSSIGSEAVIYTIRPAAPVTLSYHPSVAPLEGKTYRQDEVTSYTGHKGLMPGVIRDRGEALSEDAFEYNICPCKSRLQRAVIARRLSLQPMLGSNRSAACIVTHPPSLARCCTTPSYWYHCQSEACPHE